MDSSRRSLLKKVAASAIAFPILSSSPRPLFAQGPTGAVDEKGPQAQALGYYHDVAKVDVAKWPRKGQPESANANCANCQLLLNRGQKVAGMDGEWGLCALFQDGLVNVNGWCNSWVQKQGA